MKMRDESQHSRVRPQKPMTRMARSGQLSRKFRTAEVYGTPTWRRLRKTVLGRWPACVACARTGNNVGADVLDHIIPIQQAQGWPKRFDIRNLQGLCNPCHIDKTRRIDAPGNNPAAYRHDLRDQADMRPSAMKQWAADTAAADADGVLAGNEPPTLHC